MTANTKPEVARKKDVTPRLITASFTGWPGDVTDAKVRQIFESNGGRLLAAGTNMSDAMRDVEYEVPAGSTVRHANGICDGQGTL